MKEIKLGYYDIGAVEYIFDKYGREKLFKQMTIDDLRDLVYDECNELSSANEELEFGTYGENFQNDISSELVYEYIMKERGEYNAKNKVQI